MLASVRVAKMASRQAPIMARGFADASHVPPIALFGLEAKYANALYTSASRDGSLKKVEKDLQLINKNIKAVPAFGDFLGNPTIGRKTKQAEIDAIMTKAKVTPITQSFFSVLAENGRLGNSAKIISTFDELMAASRGEVSAKIISAEPLTAAQVKTLTKSLDSYAAGQKIVLETEVDEEILGGLKVQIGDKFIDLSITTKIANMDRLLASAV